MADFLLALRCPRLRTLQQNEVLIEDLEKMLKSKNGYRSANNFLTFLAVCSIPLGVIFHNSILSFSGICWITSGFFSFCSERESKERDQIKLQIELLQTMSELKEQSAIRDQVKKETVQVNFGPIGLN